MPENNTNISQYRKWQLIINRFIEISKTETKNYFGNPRFLEDQGTINVVTIRNNAENSFNSSSLWYNDDSYIIENRPNDSYLLHHYKVTADPCAPKNKIAHLCEGAYESYVVRPHRWMLGRTALCQDAGEVRIFRTAISGEILFWEWGFFGINYHNQGGYSNSSLACTIYPDAHHSEIKYTLTNSKPVHKKLTSGKYSYFLINKKTLERILNELNISIQ